MLISVKVNAELERVLQGVEFIQSVKTRIREKLEEKIDSRKVDAILTNHSIDDIELEKEEAFHLFKVIFDFTKDQLFNPVLLFEENKKEEKSVGRYYKDTDKSLYYNYDFKMKFIELKYSEDTQRVVRALFRKTAIFEKTYAKDLCNFNLEELKEVLKSLKSKTIRSLQNQISTIENYIDFAQKEGMTEYRINYATAFDTKEKIENLLDKEAEENMIFDRDEIMEIAMHADNAQDGVIIGLLFDGVSHKNEFEELVNLTKNDVDFEKQEINLKDRVIPISTETKILVKEALNQQEYVSINGDRTRRYKIADGINVIRGLRGKAKVKGQIISQRLIRIAEAFGYEYLNATTIAYSGQLDYAKRLMEKCNDLDEVVNKVLHRFGVPINTSSQFYLKTRIEKFLLKKNK